MILVALLSLSSSFISNLYMEMSMDTCPYGTDPAPVLRMKNGGSPRIDSIGDTTLYGNFNKRNLIWNEEGKCECGIPDFDLEYNELFYNYRRKE